MSNIESIHRRQSYSIRKTFLLFFGFAFCNIVGGFVSKNPKTTTTTIASNPLSPLFLSAPVEQDQQSKTADEEEDWQDPDAPAGIDGAQFFGGNKQKEEFYDPVAERQAAEEVQAAQRVTTYGRFFASSDTPSAAFDTVAIAKLGQALQQTINSVLYSSSPSSKTLSVSWAPNVSWDTPFATTSDAASPLAALKSAKEFYKRVDLAIVGGRQLSDKAVELSWEVAVVWPTFWAPRVLLSGTSTLTLKEAFNETSESTTVAKQVDNVFSSSNNNLLPLLSSQIAPRFWDWYHIGMSPTTELFPRETVKSGYYNVYRLPSRLVLSPTIVETGTRSARNAQIIPNHAFTCIIKTMGPQKQDYIPTSPVQVQIGKRASATVSGDNDDRLELLWSVPMSVHYQATNEELPLPGDNPEDDPDTAPTCSYVQQQPRQVATMAFGGNVQDKEITDIRKKLYEQVLKDGWKPKLDDDGRPIFFFWQNDVKACYTEEGLGMSIYEWRPALAKSNEVGIELQID